MLWRPRAALVFVSLASLLGCSRQVAPDPADNLAGLKLPLTGTGAVRLVTSGRVGDVAAEVLLEVAQPITLVTTACFKALPTSDTTVRYPLPSGGFVDAPQILLGRARIGDRRLGGIDAALIEGKACEVTIGSDVLAPYALEVDPSVRTVTVVPTRSREAYVQLASSAEAQASGNEFHLVELARDPATDWPMLAARATQDDHQLTGAFVLNTGAADSLLDAAAAREAAFSVGPEFIRELGIPPTVQLPKALGGTMYGADKLELSPGFGLRHVHFEGAPKWKNKAVLGTLGGDIWGRFHATIDAAAGTLLLRRPRVYVSGDRQRCATGKVGTNSEEACFELHQEDDPNSGVDWVTTVWRELPKGGRVFFDVVDAAGQTLDGACRVGISFGKSGRGISAAHQLPWAGLERSMPQCASTFAAATAIRFGLWQDAPLSECPGTCAFVHDLSSDRVSCECQGSGFGAMGEAEQRFLDSYRNLFKRRGASPKKPGEPEPDEPQDGL